MQKEKVFKTRYIREHHAYAVVCQRCGEQVELLPPPAAMRGRRQEATAHPASEAERTDVRSTRRARAAGSAEAEGRSFGLSIGTYPTTVIEQIEQSKADSHLFNEQAERIIQEHVCLDYALEYQGNLITSRPRPHVRIKVKGNHSGGGTRGKIQGFSRGSRNRAMKALAKYDRAVVSKALFVTLTYPADFPDGRRAKRDFKVFTQRLKRKYPQAGVFWRMEAQTRGAPHFHLMVFGLGFIPAQWIAHAWYAVVDSGDEKHLRAGTQIKKVRNYQQAVNYVSKYITKVDELPIGDDWGRLWGQLGNYVQYLHEIRKVRLTRSQFARYVRFIESHRGAARRSYNKYLKSQNRLLRKPYKSKRDRFIFYSGSWFFDSDILHDSLFAIVGAS